MISRDFKEFIELLNKERVKYLVVGGYALAFHGHPRYTKDLDIWVWMDAENARRLLAALEAFGFSSLGLSEKDFLKAGYVIQLGRAPNRIDLLTSLTALDFNECFQRREELVLNDLKINFLDIESLRENKRALGRHQDLADLENLE